MAEVTATAKYACPACGAQATWNPGKHALVCGSCGTESAAELKTQGEVVEHDLLATLATLQTRETGLAREAVEVKCRSCEAISSFEPHRVAQNCEFCGSAALVPYEAVNEVIRPELLLPMKVAETQVREDMRRWYGSRWFAPNALALTAMTDTLRGLYLPYWTFDANVHASWTAESGTHYTEGKKRRTRWRSVEGQIFHSFDDELICGSKGVHPVLLRQVEPFPTEDAVPYDPGYLVGFVVERSQIDLVAAAQASRTEMHRKIKALCREQVPGDTCRNLQTEQKYSAQTFKHILAPVWLLSYIYRGKSFQVVVNGYTGKIAGEHPLSWIKIFFAVMAVILVAIVVISIAN